jgi:hypothetical protein
MAKKVDSVKISTYAIPVLPTPPNTCVVLSVVPGIKVKHYTLDGSIFGSGSGLAFDANERKNGRE